MNFLQNEIVLGVLVFTLAVNMMVFIILGARKLLVSSGNVSISMNEAAKSVEVEAGGKLLQTLASQNLFLSSIVHPFVLRTTDNFCMYEGGD